MRILYFHQHFVTPAGAGGVRSYAMARKLIRQGHKVVMVSGSFAGGNSGLDGPFENGVRRGLVDGINVVEFDLAYSNGDNYVRRTWIFLKFAFRSVALVFSEQYDLIFATSTPLTAGIPGIFARWLRGKKFVFEVRDLWPELPRAMGVIKNPMVLWAMGILEWANYHSAHRLIALAPGIVDGIVRRGIRREKIALVPNGCDLEIFSDISGSWRPEGIRPTDLLAVFAGTHGVANGLDSILDAAAVLKSRGREDIKILLIGNGKLKANLQLRAKREGLTNLLFHDAVNKGSLAGLMSSADLGLQCLANVPAFYYGTSPNKFFDYIAAGLPVLNNYPGWLADMITENQCGFTVPPNNPVAFANSLEEAANDRLKLKLMGQNGRSLAEKRFDRKLLSEQWVNWVIGLNSL